MQVLDQLKRQGYRLTQPRQELLKVLASYPLSAQEIFDKLHGKKVKIDLASIYRSLELFVDIGVVHVVELGEDKKRYEIVDENNHHHHLVCNNCGTIEDITISENKFIKEIKDKSQFKVDHHHLEFFGLCKDCQ